MLRGIRCPVSHKACGRWKGRVPNPKPSLGPATTRRLLRRQASGISGLVVEYIVAIDVTRVRFPADAFSSILGALHVLHLHAMLSEDLQGHQRFCCHLENLELLPNQ